MGQWAKTDTLASAPKYLEAAEKANVVFIDVTEAGVAANRAKGLKTPGWNLYNNAGGRNRTECLVAMKVSAVDAGDLGVTGDTLDEDAIVADA
jgi:hypothetical protein